MFSLSTLRHFLAEELEQVESLLAKLYNSSLGLVEKISFPLFNPPGKLIRPIVVILNAHIENTNHNDHYTKIATALELIHVASLLHDDIIDATEIRRGKQAAYKKWGKNAAILVGDFLLAQASQVIANLEDPIITKSFTKMTVDLAEGEILQLNNKNNLDISKDLYFKIITKKTASIFAFNTRTKYGLHFGRMFQIMNDLADCKTNNDDLQQGIFTLPIIYVLQKSTTTEKNLIKEITLTKNQKLLPSLYEIFDYSGALSYTLEIAKQEAKFAKQELAGFSDSVYKRAALDLIDIVLTQ